MWCCGGACIACLPLIRMSIALQCGKATTNRKIVYPEKKTKTKNRLALWLTTVWWRCTLLQLQRDWSSRSCTNVNRMGNKTVPTSTSATMAATLSRQTRASTTAPQSSDPQNTSTLPYFRNVHKNSQQNQIIPKSVSTWGPLHKPSHWKVRR